MAEDAVGCARVTGTVGDGPPPGDDEPLERGDTTREIQMTSLVGRQAPDFTAPAYHRGGFTSVKLSDHAGKWLFLCFYPGDFTFV